METFGKYVFDGNGLLEKTYELLCAYFASKAISRRSDPSDKLVPLALLEKRFFETKVSRLLIEIAASLRVMSDQILKLPINDPQRQIYDMRVAEVDKYEFGLFDDLNLTLRETCNKIIRSDVFQPHTKEGSMAHETDVAFWAGMDNRHVKWKHI